MSETSLPAGWAEVPVSQVAEVRLGRQRSPDQMTGEHLRPYLRAANITWQGLNLADVNRMNFTPREFDVYQLRPGDVLLSEASGSATEVGKPAVWRAEIPDCCFQNTLIRVRSRGPLPEYLYYHFLDDARAGRFAEAGKGVGINHLGADRLSKWPLRLAPLNEQRRIVAKLDDLLARSRRAKEALDAMPPLLETLRRSILAAAFRGDLTADWRAKHPDVEPADRLLGRIRVERRKKWEESELARLRARGKAPTDDRWKQKYDEPQPADAGSLPELPDGWAWATVAEIAESQDHRREPVKLGHRAERRGPYPYYGAFGVIDRIDDFIFDGTYVLIAEDGKNLLDRRRPIALVASGKFWVNNHAHVLTPNAAVPCRYLSDYFNHVTIADRLTGIDQVKLTAAALASLPVAIAPAEEALEIERILAAAQVRVTSLGSLMQVSFEQVKQLETAMLSTAFRGELLAQNAEDEPSAVMLTRLGAADDADRPPRPSGVRKRGGRSAA